MSRRISQQQLESYLWGAATLLRGTIDAGDYKQFIFPLLFYKRVCDVFDEETQAALNESGGDAEFAQYPENHRFQVPSDAHWRNVRQKATNVGRAIQEGMRAIETANPDKLFGIFGDAQWTNKDRLSDTMLRDLVEHFSKLTLALGNLPEDELGQGYEFLIKKFADDAGHTAAEFYTNRTVVHLMTEMLEPQPGESIYDPTCGSGGMLLSSITHLRRQSKEWRNVRLYGQERNLMTSSIARMNCFLHGIEDFRIERGDTLSEPKFVQGDRLMQFDVVLANPPYSIKQWDRDAFASDPWGRNLYGTPPQGRADYAFWQHILCSLRPKTGRCAILFPHGVLFRQEEADMRSKLVEADLIECVLGLGPNLFYNSPMEACVVICRSGKPKKRKGRILLINAVNEVTRERAQSFLTDDHIQHIVKAYEKFADEPGFARIATLEEVRQLRGSLNIPMYVGTLVSTTAPSGTTLPNDSIRDSVVAWLTSASQVRAVLNNVLDTGLGPAQLLPVAPIAGLPSWLKRTEWRRLPFGAFADSINERVQPADAAEAIYVGLDDLDPGSLHIRRWGAASDVIGTKLRFRKGDIIFGRRRAYQRKLAVAEMEGICSAHAMVARAKSDLVLPDFLPFLMVSDRFMNRAVEISVGSLSPTINWTALKLEEFDLPPRDQQRCMADILWAADEAIVAWKASLEQHVNAFKAFASSATMRGLRNEPTRETAIGLMPASWRCLRLGEVTAHSAYGPRFPSSSYSPDGNAKQIRTTDFDRSGGIDFIEVPTAKLDDETVRLHRLRSGDFLLSRSGEYAGLTAVFSDPSDGRAYIPGAFLIRYRFNELLSAEYLMMLCDSEFGQKFVQPLATGSAQPNISGSAFSRLFIPVPPRDEQDAIVARVSELRRVGVRLAEHNQKMRKLFSALVNTFS